MKDEELKYYEKRKDWNFDMFEIKSERLTNWDMFKILNELATKESKILDLGTGGGEKVIKYFPECNEILGTDFSPEMINTANFNLKESGRKNITFKVMNNLNMNVPDNYYDVVVARHTIIDPNQIYKCLKRKGYLIIRGVDKYDCWDLKTIFNKGQGFNDEMSISILDYKNVLNAGFKDAELSFIYEIDYFKNKHLFEEFLKKVPILDDFSEAEKDNKDYYKSCIDNELLDRYIKENTYDGKIKLLRRYYGITARK